MTLLRIALVLLAAAAAVGQYVQERYRLVVIAKLSGAEARRQYEEQRRRSERGMLVLALIAGLAGAVALFDLVVGIGPIK